LKAAEPGCYLIVLITKNQKQYAAEFVPIKGRNHLPVVKTP
jgi:hypothetical protein